MKEMTHHFIVISITSGIIIVGLVVFLVGYTSVLNVVFPTTGSSNLAVVMTPVQFTTIAQGTQSAVTTRSNYLITSSDEMASLWDFIKATTTPPSIDFKTQIVIAVFAGKPDTSITIAKIEDSNARMVSVTLSRSAGACPSKVAVSPYEIVTVPATMLPFAHRDISTTIDCR